MPGEPDKRRNALDELVANAIDYEASTVRYPLSREVMMVGVVGGLLAIAIGIIGQFVSGSTFGSGSFFLVAESWVVWLADLLHAVSLPLIALGLLSLVLFAVVSARPVWAQTGYLAGVAAVTGSAGGVVSTAIIAVMVINLVIWIVLTIVVIALFVAIIVGMFSAAA
jgi:hypothetical protein